MSTVTERAPMTSAEWWASIKKSPSAFKDWLMKQLAGEKAAAVRIQELSDRFCRPESGAKEILAKIIKDEKKHALWIEKIVRTYYEEVEVVPETHRYWDEVEPDIETFSSLQYACAVAAHAETMRLERIKAIASDDEFGAANPLIQSTFQAILQDEQFHAESFAMLAGEYCMQKAKDNHLSGMKALGLVV